MTHPFDARLLLVVVVSCATAWLDHAMADQTSGNAANQPHLVLIIADDMNWDDCGAYGHPAIRTPNIDRLAAEGLLFQHAYVTTSSCSPSRSSILTGKYPHNTGAEQLHWPLPEGSNTFADQLRKLGYYTAAAGKWHLGDAVRDHFDRVYEASTAGFVLPTDGAGKPAKMIAAQPSGCEDWERALDDRPPDTPFFLWLAALDPHREYSDGALDPPHQLTDVVVPPYLPDAPAVREDLRLYYDEIGRLDSYVGKVLEKLKSQAVEENTLVLYVQLLQKGLVGVDAKSGRFLWRYDKLVSRFNANIPTPVASEDIVYAGSAGTGGGAVRLEPKDGGVAAEELYFGAKLPSAIGGAVKVGSFLFGTTSQAMLCVEFDSGQVKWQERALGAASLCFADGRLYLHGENGEVALVESSPDGYRERGRFTPAEPPQRSNGMEKAWAYPVVANGRLYIRDLGCLWCYDLRVTSASAPSATSPDSPVRN